MNLNLYITKKENHICDSLSLSGYQDSNLGPPAPKAGALTGLRYTPMLSFIGVCECKGIYFFHSVQTFRRKNYILFEFSSFFVFSLIFSTKNTFSSLINAYYFSYDFSLRISFITNSASFSPNIAVVCDKVPLTATFP